MLCALQGGVSAERAERDKILQEAEANAAAHRQAFDDMVAAAKAAGPMAQPHDPMRFRAQPPGDLWLAHVSAVTTQLPCRFVT